jgi:hypothetical protein
MITPDLINAAFEAVGATFLALDCRALARDKCLRGVYWPGRVFFASWGAWNVLYYPAIGQWLSFAAGLLVLAVNAVWCLLAWRYRNV